MTTFQLTATAVMILMAAGASALRAAPGAHPKLVTMGEISPGITAQMGQRHRPKPHPGRHTREHLGDKAVTVSELEIVVWARPFDGSRAAGRRG